MCIWGVCPPLLIHVSVMRPNKPSNMVAIMIVFMPHHWMYVAGIHGDGNGSWRRGCGDLGITHTDPW